MISEAKQKFSSISRSKDLQICPSLFQCIMNLVIPDPKDIEKSTAEASARRISH